MSDDRTGVGTNRAARDDRRSTGERGPTNAPLPLDSLFEALGRVAGGEGGATLDRVAASPRHRHLPRLAAADVVDYDRRDRTPRDRGGGPLERWLDAVERGGDV